MAKSAWLGSELLPVRVRLVLAVVATVCVLTLSLLPADQVGFSSRVDNVIGRELPHPIAIFVNDTAPASATNPIADLIAGSPALSANLEENEATASPSPSPAPSPAADPEVSDEKFLSPLLSAGVGAGNQLMEYSSAALIARATNRTLCLAPFFSGPGKHRGRFVRTSGGLMFEERYNASSLARFTRVASLEHCLQHCNYTLDSNVFLRGTSSDPIIRGWKTFQYQNTSWNLKWYFAKWQSTGAINATLGDLSDRCVGLGGLFPGLRWRGAFLSVSAFLQPAMPVSEAATILQTYGIGKDIPYIAVHWRFYESMCPKHQIGLCFTRCSDGSVVNSNLHSAAKEWLKKSKKRCHFRGVILSKWDIIATIEERAAKFNHTTVYMATDGWIRGSEGVALMKEVVLRLRRRGLYVIGLWNVPGLPNFSDGTYYDPYLTMGKHHVINGQQIALVEQELCVRSAVFLGSGQSTWSLAVFRSRLAKRRSAEILDVNAHRNLDPKAQDVLVSETLLSDKHAAGMQCEYPQFHRRAEVDETVETYADEYPDGWLDLDACEGRIGRGGHCQVAKCF